VNAEGDLSVDEFTVEGIKLEQMRASGALHDCILGCVKRKLAAPAECYAPGASCILNPGRPRCDAELERVDLRQVPTPRNLTERFTGLASGIVHLTTKAWARGLLQRLAARAT